MYMIVVGAGAVGTGLAELALRDKHNLVMVEVNKERARAALEKYDLQVINADIAEGGILEEAGADRADALIAATDDDAVNLMAMTMGQEYGVGKLLSIVNHQRHRRLFERLGVEILFHPRLILARHLYGFLRYPDFEEVIPLAEEQSAFKLTVAESSALAGKTLRALNEEEIWPEGILAILLQREDQVFIPHGDTKLRPGDQLTMLAEEPPGAETRRLFTT
jgi:trk system potassium uptake protein TrkA